MYIHVYIDLDAVSASKKSPISTFFMHIII